MVFSATSSVTIEVAKPEWFKVYCERRLGGAMDMKRYSPEYQEAVVRKMMPRRMCVSWTGGGERRFWVTAKITDREQREKYSGVFCRLETAGREKKRRGRGSE